MALGSYPDVTLKEARKTRDKARDSRQSGTNPVQQRKADKIAKATSNATTYEAVARELHEAKASGWSATHTRQWLRCSEKDLFPYLGSLPLGAVSAPMLLDVVRKVEARGAIQMAHDLCEYGGQVFRYGVATGRCSGAPAADLRGALKPTRRR